MEQVNPGLGEAMTETKKEIDGVIQTSSLDNSICSIVISFSYLKFKILTMMCVCSYTWRTIYY